MVTSLWGDLHQMNINWDGDRIFDRSIQLAILAVAVYAARSVAPSPPASIEAASVLSVTEIVARYWMVAVLLAVTAINIVVTSRRPPRPKGPFLRGQLIIGS